MGLNRATIGKQGLAVDPSAIWAREKRHHRGNVTGLAQALQRRNVFQMLNLLRGFAI